MINELIEGNNIFQLETSRVDVEQISTILKNERHGFEFSYDYLEWTFINARFPLSKLEKIWYVFQKISESIQSYSLFYDGISLKTPEHYMTEDGYYLGSFVWYMTTHLVKGEYRFKYKVFGDSPENLLVNALYYSTSIKLAEQLPGNQKANVIESVVHFKDCQKEMVSRYSRYE